MISDWTKLYSERWIDLITPDSIAHPAKFSRALIRHIYAHAIEEGWLSAGDQVLDCFGGVALGAFDAMTHGLCWTGVELEEKFCLLGNQNIALWNERYKGKLATWGTARLIQGDSRKLCEVVGTQAAIVSSPPFCGSLSSERGGGIVKAGQTKDSNGYTHRWKAIQEGYGSDSANLGNLREGDISAVIASPPYSTEALGHKGKGSAINEAKGLHARMNDNRYGESPGQLTQLKEGDFSAVITSPPFVESLASDDPQKRGGLFADPKRANDKTLTATYGETVGQLGCMKAGALITSPPYEGTDLNGKRATPCMERKAELLQAAGHDSEKWLGKKRCSQMRNDGYIGSQGQIGETTGETFWQASRQILEQCHQVLAPGSHAIFVCKDFVRAKKIVPFCEQWAALCEAVGFRLLHIHRAWLVEHKDAQHRLDGGCDELSVERKSFFRRLAEKKGSPRIDFETVMCFERI